MVRSGNILLQLHNIEKSRRRLIGLNKHTKEQMLLFHLHEVMEDRKTHRIIQINSYLLLRGKGMENE